MNTKHTPGPWKVQPDHKNRFITSGPHSISDDEWDADPDNQIIASLRDCQNQPANARLIAAAPDLLAALEAALPQIQRFRCTDPNGETCDNPVLKQARAAIAKAKGE